MANEYAIEVLEAQMERLKKTMRKIKPDSKVMPKYIAELQSAIEKLQADKVIELCEKCMAKRIIKLSENGGIPI